MQQQNIKADKALSGANHVDIGDIAYFFLIIDTESEHRSNEYYFLHNKTQPLLKTDCLPGLCIQMNLVKSLVEKEYQEYLYCVLL